MKLVSATIQRHRIDPVHEAMLGVGIANIIISEVRVLDGGGALVDMVKVEAVVPDQLVEEVVAAVQEAGMDHQAQRSYVWTLPVLSEVGDSEDQVQLQEEGPMQASFQKSGGTVIVTANGRVDGANAREFQDALGAAIDPEVSGMILNLSELSYISSAGLRAILLTANVLREREAKFAACALPDRIREVFQISGFDQIVPIHDTEAEAIAAFG
jgi:anti-anti-sigma factor